MAVESWSDSKGLGSSMVSLKGSLRERCQVSHKFFFFFQLKSPTRLLSPTTTIRQLQSVTAGTALHLTILVSCFFSLLLSLCLEKVFGGITGMEGSHSMKGQLRELAEGGLKPQKNNKRRFSDVCDGSCGSGILDQFDKSKQEQNKL